MSYIKGEIAEYWFVHSTSYSSGYLGGPLNGFLNGIAADTPRRGFFLCGGRSDANLAKNNETQQQYGNPRTVLRSDLMKTATRCLYGSKNLGIKGGTSTRCL